MSQTFARVPARAAGMDLTATDYSVLIAVCQHADKSGEAYPSMARIASLCRIKRPHVARSIDRLVKLGLLRRKRVPRGDGWANNEYEVRFDEVLPAEITPEARVLPEMVTGVPSAGNTGVPSDGTLTYQLTDQGTELTRKEESQEVQLKRAGVTSVETTPRSTAVCPYRGCGKPAVFDGACAAHAQLTRGKPNGSATAAAVPT